MKENEEWGKDVSGQRSDQERWCMGITGSRGQVMVPQRAGLEVTESWAGPSTGEVDVHTNP